MDHSHSREKQIHNGSRLSRRKDGKHDDAAFGTFLKIAHESQRYHKAIRAVSHHFVMFTLNNLKPF